MNYKHLHYFWTVVRAGGVLRASEQLHLSAQTLSGQINLLEERLGTPLLRKVGRGVEPTQAGQMVMQYADEIFTLGQEMEDALRGGRAAPRAPLLKVGFVDSVSKGIAYHVLEPALRLNPAPRLHCPEGTLPALMAQLALRRVDLVVSDVPLPGNLGVKAFTHLLGRSGIAFFASEKLLASCSMNLRQARAKFPQSLNAMPMLLPGTDSALRPRVDGWLRRHGLAPQIAGEFEDSALMKAFGREGLGVFPAPAVLAREISRQLEVERLGAPDDLVEEFYAISIERKITHPGVAAITQTARSELFAQR
ncbi:transcriptional activator NhaR [Caenimonas koreensis DSM 17982]|uniref:Transcriptional activator NhaR n=1 Tax=Caenimonas koreensis DSM 17982 TaxID=1121255 RepID=A0A844AYA0_9BURK|nr:transcriptional activator NhaR [Caenimonas koreensis]MRD46042.1 transcriptional activator NhaR [Caenimonas koreensis DSM 17982]